MKFQNGRYPPSNTMALRLFWVGHPGDAMATEEGEGAKMGGGGALLIHGVGSWGVVCSGGGFPRFLGRDGAVFFEGLCAKVLMMW